MEVIGTYIDVDTKILHRCKVHDCVFEKVPSSALRGGGCVKCGHDKLASQFVKTHEQYIKELNAINPNIEVIGEYENSKTKILHRCKIDNYEWYVIPGNILQGTSCPKCAGNYHLTHDEYVAKIKEINPDIDVVEEYINSQTKILHKCIIHDYEWYVIPNNIITKNVGCPKCNISKGELEISKWLEEHNIMFEPQKKFNDCKDVRSLPFDFYLCDSNVCIEYDGEQHYKSVEYFGGEEAFALRQKHDKIKTDYCERNGIKLIRIAYNENVKEKLDLLFA